MRQNERGITFIELAVVVAVSAIIALGAGVTTVQMIRGSEASEDMVVVANQCRNLGSWISRDILSAQSVNASDDVGTGDIEFAVFYWHDWETGDVHETRYIWLDSADSLKKLKRQQLTSDKNGAPLSNVMTLIADNIYSANLTRDEDRWKLNVETRSGDRSVTREYLVGQRQEG